MNSTTSLVNILFLPLLPLAKLFWEDFNADKKFSGLVIEDCDLHGLRLQVIHWLKKSGTESLDKVVLEEG